MSSWTAVAYGALDLRGLPREDADAELIAVPVLPSEPIGLVGAPALLWRRLIRGEVPDEALSAGERALVREFAAAGIASDSAEHPARVRRLPSPWLGSPLHELVYALVAGVAGEQGIDLLFIKGPVLHRQGFRDREHSGDVDVWADPDRLFDLARALTRWGWAIQPEIWEGTEVNHSVTLEPGPWGCEIDLHRRFPGCGLPDGEAFSAMLRMSTEAEFAGRTAKVPDVPSHAVVEALHKLRPVFGAPQSAALAAVAEQALVHAGEPAVDAALRLDAVEALRPALAAAFPDRDLGEPKPLPLNWRWLGRGSRLGGYFSALRMVPPSRRLAILARMVWPSREVVLLSDRLAGAASSRILLARWRRALRGVSGLRHR